MESAVGCSPSCFPSGNVTFRSRSHSVVRHYIQLREGLSEGKQTQILLKLQTELSVFDRHLYLAMQSLEWIEVGERCWLQTPAGAAARSGAGRTTPGNSPLDPDQASSGELALGDDDI